MTLATLNHCWSSIPSLSAVFDHLGTAYQASKKIALYPITTVKQKFQSEVINQLALKSLEAVSSGKRLVANFTSGNLLRLAGSFGAYSVGLYAGYYALVCIGLITAVSADLLSPSSIAEKLGETAFFLLGQAKNLQGFINFLFNPGGFTPPPNIYDGFLLFASIAILSYIIKSACNKVNSIGRALDDKANFAHRVREEISKLPQDKEGLLEKLAFLMREEPFQQALFTGDLEFFWNKMVELHGDSVVEKAKESIAVLKTALADWREIQVKAHDKLKKGQGADALRYLTQKAGEAERLHVLKTFFSNPNESLKESFGLDNLSPTSTPPESPTGSPSASRSSSGDGDFVEVSLQEVSESKPIPRVESLYFKAEKAFWTPFEVAKKVLWYPVDKLSGLAQKGSLEKSALKVLEVASFKKWLLKSAEGKLLGLIGIPAKYFMGVHLINSFIVISQIVHNQPYAFSTLAAVIQKMGVSNPIAATILGLFAGIGGLRLGIHLLDTKRDVDQEADFMKKVRVQKKKLADTTSVELASQLELGLEQGGPVVNIDALLSELKLRGDQEGGPISEEARLEGEDRLREYVAYINVAQAEYAKVATEYQEKLSNGIVTDAEKILKRELGPLRKRIAIAREILLHPSHSLEEVVTGQLTLEGMRLTPPKPRRARYPAGHASPARRNLEESLLEGVVVQ